MEVDREDVLFIGTIIGIIVTLFVGLLYGATYIWAMTFHGQKYDVVITAQAVEHSTRFGEHTNVWARVYGEQDITYKLIGRVDLEVGKTYRIVFVNQIWFTPFGFEVRGCLLYTSPSPRDISGSRMPSSA